MSEWVRQVQLATEWTRRGNYYFGIWLRAGADLEFRYTAEDVSSYEELLEWLDFACEVDVEHPAFDRITEVRSWVPQCG